MRTGRLFLLLAVAAFFGGLSALAATSVFTPRDAKAERIAEPRVLRAERLEIVDAAGNPRAWIEVDEGGNPGFFLGKADCILGSFSLVRDGRPRLDLGDACTVRAVLELGPDGTPSLTFLDREMKPCWKVP